MTDDDIELPSIGALPSLTQNRAMTRHTTCQQRDDELFDLMVADAAEVLFEEYPSSSITPAG